MAALLIDLDGVLYEGDDAVPGAAEAMAWLEQEGIPHLFLTNTTSRPRNAIVEKLASLDILATKDRVLTPPVAAVRWIARNAPGPVTLFVAAATKDEFNELEIADHDQTNVASVVVGDYGDAWTFAELNRAFRLLMNEPQPNLVALGMTRYWRAEDGLRLDTAPFVAALSHASGAEPIVLGKPARPFFETALQMLQASAEGTLMIGDDIQGDILGAQRLGIAGALVRTGKFRESDLEGEHQPACVLDSIAQLPEHWPELLERLGGA